MAARRATFSFHNPLFFGLMMVLLSCSSMPARADVKGGEGIKAVKALEDGKEADKGQDAKFKQYEGLWQTIDDETNKPRSLVKLYTEGDELKATIVKTYPRKGEKANPLFQKCRDELKNKPIIGMEILSGMRLKKGNKNNPSAWVDGEILDPSKGKYYDCKIWLEDGRLQVRGYLGFFFRTQEWLKYAEPIEVDE